MTITKKIKPKMRRLRNGFWRCQCEHVLSLADSQEQAYGKWEFRRQDAGRTTLRLDGKAIAFTGFLPSISREEAARALQAHGAKIVGVVSKKTDYVIAGAECGSKLEKAMALGIPVLDECGMFALVAE